MSKLILIIVPLSAALLSCAHEAPPKVVIHDRDWEKGLDEDFSQAIAPLGPIDSDQNAYDLIRRREREHALGSRLTATDLDEIINNSSQVLASALALDRKSTRLNSSHSQISYA